MCLSNPQEQRPWLKDPEKIYPKKRSFLRKYWILIVIVLILIGMAGFWINRYVDMPVSVTSHHTVTRTEQSTINGDGYTIRYVRKYYDMPNGWPHDLFATAWVNTDGSRWDGQLLVDSGAEAPRKPLQYAYEEHWTPGKTGFSNSTITEIDVIVDFPGHPWEYEEDITLTKDKSPKSSYAPNNGGIIL